MQFTSDDESQWWAKPVARNNLAAGENRRNPKRQSNKHYHLQQAFRIHSRLKNLRHARSKWHYFGPCWSIVEKQQLPEAGCACGCCQQGAFSAGAPVRAPAAGEGWCWAQGKARRVQQTSIVSCTGNVFTSTLPFSRHQESENKRPGQAEEPHSLCVQPRKGSIGLNVNLVFGQRWREIVEIENLFICWQVYFTVLSYSPFS